MVIYNKVSYEMENNNKESFKLLDVSSSGSASESVVPEVVINPRKKKLRRRSRRTRALRPGEVHHSQGCICRGQTVFTLFATILLVCWLLVLTWLAIVLNSELTKLDGSVREVVAGNQNVPAELQECHSLTRELQKNQTALYSQIINLARQLHNHSLKLDDVQDGLHTVQAKLDGAPELVNIPQTVNDLQKSVAVFGSQIRDFSTTADNLKAQITKDKELSTVLVQNLTSIRETVDMLLNISHQSHLPLSDGTDDKKVILETIDRITKNLSLVNDTLTKKLTWVVEDQRLDSRKLQELQDKNLNISARVTTLEGEFARIGPPEVLNITIANISDTVIDAEKRIHELDMQLSQLQLQNSQFSSNSSWLLSTVTALQQAVAHLTTPAVEVTDHTLQTELPEA